MDANGELLQHYAGQEESQRLIRSGHGRLELSRTRELLVRFLPPAPARVLDVGGATGIHAAWLAARGYDVHLIDPVPKHVRAASDVGTFSTSQGDARALPEADESVDAVLVLGPLYHLVDAAGRNQALAEAYRVLRPQGVVFAAAIGRFMALLDWASSATLSDDVAQKLASVIRSGIHDPTLGFVRAYFHTAPELRGEVEGAGFTDVRVLGIEGPVWTAVDAAGEGRQDDFMDSAVRAARMTEETPELLASNAHLMAVARRR